MVTELELAMDRRLTHFALLVSFALPVAAATSSAAQVGSPAPPPAPYSRGLSQGQTPADQSDRLRQMLDLTPDQEGALQAFVAAATPRPGEADQMRDQARRDASLPTPERVDRIVAHYDQMRAKLAAWAQATKAFYAQLSPDQKRVFDNLPPSLPPQGGAGPRPAPPLPVPPGSDYPLPPPGQRN
jgi:hypothetical protein